VEVVLEFEGYAMLPGPDLVAWPLCFVMAGINAVSGGVRSQRPS
jgi:hypothetical protein